MPCELTYTAIYYRWSELLSIKGWLNVWGKECFIYSSVAKMTYVRYTYTHSHTTKTLRFASINSVWRRKKQHHTCVCRFFFTSINENNTNNRIFLSRLLLLFRIECMVFFCWSSSSFAFCCVRVYYYGNKLALAKTKNCAKEKENQKAKPAKSK